MLLAVLRSAAALAVTLGLLAVAFRLLRRVQVGQLAGRRGLPLHVLQRVAVGPKQSVALVRVGERVLVLSVADAGSSLLTELTDEARAMALTAEPAPASQPLGLSAAWHERLAPLARRLRFDRLRHVLPLLLAAGLLLTPAVGRAQARRAPAPAPATRTVATAPLAAGAPAPAARATARSTGAGPAVLGPAAPQVDVRVGEGRDSLHLSGAVGLVVLVGVLTLLPALFLLMTSFTRILIVLHFLRSAMGTQTVPPGQLLVAMAVLLTGVVMNPVLQEANRDALQPYLHGQVTQAQAYERALKPFREFMVNNVREKDLATFAELSGVEDARSVEDLPIVTVVAAFVTSELRVAFQMGFVIFLPFVVVDLLVSSVLMSMGMFMLPPMMVSLPFKLLLFVLADGWSLVVQNLVASFH